MMVDYKCPFFNYPTTISELISFENIFCILFKKYSSLHAFDDGNGIKQMNDIYPMVIWPHGVFGKEKIIHYEICLEFF